MSDSPIPQVPQRPKRPSKTPSDTSEGENAPFVGETSEPPSNSGTTPQPVIPLRPKRKSKEPEVQKGVEGSEEDVSVHVSVQLDAKELDGKELDAKDASLDEQPDAAKIEEKIEEKIEDVERIEVAQTIEDDENIEVIELSEEPEVNDESVVGEIDKETGIVESLEAPLVEEKQVAHESDIVDDTDKVKLEKVQKVEEEDDENETKPDSEVVVPPRPIKKTEKEPNESAESISEKSVESAVSEFIQEPVIPQRPAKVSEPTEPVTQIDEEGTKVEQSQPIEPKDVLETDESETIPIAPKDVSIESESVPDKKLVSDIQAPKSTEETAEVQVSPATTESPVKTESPESTGESEVKIPTTEKSVPVIPTRPLKQPTNPTRTGDSAESSNAEVVSSPSPAIPSRPVKSDDQKKAPPPKPKKLSSKIAAFQQMFNQPVPEPPRPDASRSFRSTGRLSSEKKDFASNLQNMMGRGIALPGMANPEMLQNLKASNDETEEKSSDTVSEPTPTASIARRARGPKGKRLPKSIQESTVTVESPYKVAVHDVWEMEFTKKEPEQSEEVEEIEEVEEVQEPAEVEELEKTEEIEVVDETATGDIIDDHFESERKNIETESPEIISEDEHEGSKHEGSEHEGSKHEGSKHKVVRSIEEVDLAIEELRDSREPLAGVTDEKLPISVDTFRTSESTGTVSSDGSSSVSSEIKEGSASEKSSLVEEKTAVPVDPSIEGFVMMHPTAAAPSVQGSQAETFGILPPSEAPDTSVTLDDAIGAFDTEDKDVESDLQSELTGTKGDGS